MAPSVDPLYELYMYKGLVPREIASFGIIAMICCVGIGLNSSLVYVTIKTKPVTCILGDPSNQSENHYFTNISALFKMDFAEWSYSFQIQLIYLSICISIPSAALYIAEIVTIVRHKEFRNSFYDLFVMRRLPAISTSTKLELHRSTTIRFVLLAYSA
uniref:Uncharacterized protein n=1 Tax=Globodera rostochiensis TaxID=31243 RepID=A0A914HRQ2_GLORO